MTAAVEAIAAQWAAELPRDFARQLAAALRAGPTQLAALAARAAQPNSAAAVRTARRLVESGDGAYAAGLLIGRLGALEEQPDITPVWTGPKSALRHSRLTLAVVAELVDEAQREILLVSYATVPGKAVRDALAAAVARGVAVTLLLERRADNPGFKGRAEPFPGLAARRLHWPAAARPSRASMHAKLLVVDRRTALVGSANLTGSALEDNLECGVLIRGGLVPDLLAKHLDHVEGIRRLS
jgi:phosphatidylserine/phosphatidylglycerophosphate/cardiolipin synthase-like enzyme